MLYTLGGRNECIATGEMLSIIELQSLTYRESSPTPVCWGGSVQAPTVFRIVLKADVPGLSRAVSTTVRTAASPSAAHMAR